jgi:hypothetical protein
MCNPGSPDPKTKDEWLKWANNARSNNAAQCLANMLETSGAVVVIAGLGVAPRPFVNAFRLHQFILANWDTIAAHAHEIHRGERRRGTRDRRA